MLKPLVRNFCDRRSGDLGIFLSPYVHKGRYAAKFETRYDNVSCGLTLNSDTQRVGDIICRDVSEAPQLQSTVQELHLLMLTQAHQ